MGGVSRLVIGLFVAVSLLVGCTDSSRATLPPLEERPGSATAPFALNPGAAESAAFGDAVAVVNPAWFAGRGDISGLPAVATMSADGTWRELPRPDPVGTRRMLSTDDGLFLLGVDGRRLQLQFLGLDDAEWSELDIPDMEFHEDTEFGEDASADRFAVMGTSNGHLIADETGDVRLEPFEENTSRRVCVVGDQLIEVRTRTDIDPRLREGSTTTLNETWALDLTDGDSEWSRRATPPSVNIVGTALTCGTDGPIALGVDTEVAYDAGADQWAVRQVELPPSVNNFMNLLRHGVRDDGTLFVNEPSGVVYRRTPDGVWSDTGVTANELVVTPFTAFAVGPDNITPVP